MWIRRGLDGLSSARKQVTIFLSFGQTLLYAILRACEGGILFSLVPNYNLFYHEKALWNLPTRKKIVDIIMNEILASLIMVL